MWATHRSTCTFHLERWIDPAKLGWYSGDHHIHAAGCAHYDKPTEGVFPQDMMRHILGEDLKVGEVLSWGPSWYFQKTFFEGSDNPLSTAKTRCTMTWKSQDFPPATLGIWSCLGWSKEDYPGTKRIEDWPSWGMPILRWAKKQGAVVGYPALRLGPATEAGEAAHATKFRRSMASAPTNTSSALRRACPISSRRWTRRTLGSSTSGITH